jgi:hypothetical protein
MAIKNEIKSFISRIIIFTIILTSISAILYLTFLKPFYIKSFPLQLLLIGSLTTYSHVRLMKACEQNIRRFTSVFMLSVTLKLMVYLSFLLICLLIDHSNALAFVLTFLILYICYTIFEVTQALKFFKK